MTTRKITALVIMGALIAALSATTAFADYKTTLTLTLKGGSAVSNPTYDETYELTVPSSLRIANEGWNALGSMTVKYSGSSTGFNTAKKLVVTAGSTNNFALVADGGGSISYFLATSEDDSAATTSFTFTAAQITAGASQDLGVNVGSFTGASDGTYTDEITYSVEVQNAATSLLSLTVYDDYNFYGGNKTFYYVEGETWSQAITNHPTENASWSINGTSVNLSGTAGDVSFSSDGSAVNANTVIDATKSYSLP
ncbi:MAG: hypothetical protein IJG37_10300 [Synergistaceae bacterium]|nr:hypothetical protein [Synergistaceae bacterium]